MRSKTTTGTGQAPVSSSGLCRTCMASNSENSVELISLGTNLEEDASIANVICELTSVQVNGSNGLPEGICASCVTELRQFVGFIKKVRESDRKLRQMFKCGGIKTEDAGWWLPQQQGNDLVEVPKVEMEEPDPEEEIVEEEYLEYDEALSWKEEEPLVEAESISFELVDYDSEAEFIGFDNEEKEVKPRKIRKRKIKIMPEVTDTGDEIIDFISDSLDEVEQETFRVLETNEQDFICCSCFHVFPSSIDLMAHGETHFRKNRFNLTKPNVCDICFRRYTTPQALEAHKKQSRIVKIYECIRCRVRFNNAKRRRQHAHNHPQTEVIQSTVIAPIRMQPNYRKGKICCAQACGISFPTDELLIAHAHEVHRLNRFEASLPEHKDKPFECPVCFKRFQNKNALRLHQKRKYKNPANQCSICGMKVPGAAALATHERVHRAEKPFQCESCHKAFASPALLKAHSIVHFTDKLFVCPVCGTGFQRKATLQNHELLHSGQLPFQCEECPKAFRVKSRLELHMRSHTGVRPYQCRYCEKSFADHSNRQRHEMGHTGIKPYKCTHCDKTFITKRLQAEHESSHHDSAVFSCSICKASFSTLAALKKHNIVHAE